MRYTTDPNEPSRPHGWTDWYRFARNELGYAHEESAEYANLRFVEEQNRDTLRGGGGAGERPARSFD
jgi:hypothetical protein